MSVYSSIRGFRMCASRVIQWRRNIHSSTPLNNIVHGGAGAHKPTPFQKRMLVFTKTYPSVAEIPERVTKSQMKTSFDKFRVKVSIGIVFLTFVFAALTAVIGRKEMMEGNSVTKNTLRKRAE